MYVQNYCFGSGAGMVTGKSNLNFHSILQLFSLIPKSPKGVMKARMAVNTIAGDKDLHKNQTSLCTVLRQFITMKPMRSQGSRKKGGEGWVL